MGKARLEKTDGQGSKQGDDGHFGQYPAQAQAWGLRALQACFEGLDRATFFVHIRRGDPEKPLGRQGIACKADASYYADVFGWFSESTLDVISIEGAQSELDLAVLPEDCQRRRCRDE